MSFTVVPLHNLDLPAGSCIPFGDKFVLQDVPKWLKNDTEFLNTVSRTDRVATLDAKHALIAEYEATSIGQPDPDWMGTQPRGIQELRFQSAILANMALWLIQPSSVCFTVGFHALTRLENGETVDPPFILLSEREGPLYCHPHDVGNPVSSNHVIKAAKLYTALTAVPRKNPLWEAMRAFWAALTMNPADLRYPFFWMGLESIFGSEDTNEIGYKLAQRISFFLADSPDIARELFRKVKKCYKMRSTIIHGRWKDDPQIEGVMADTESIVRTVVRRMMDSPEMIATFISKQRDKFLEDWVFSRSTDPPPFPQKPASVQGSTASRAILAL